MATARVAPEEKESSAFLPSAFNQEQFFERNVNMSYESYSDQMKNPLWQKKRLHMLESKGWKCEMCGCGEKDAKTFHVHHKQYKSGAKIWEYEDEWLAVLCDKCHKETHQILDNIKQAIVDTPCKHLSAIADCARYISVQKEDVYTFFDGDDRKLSSAMESIIPIVRKYGFEKWMNIQGFMWEIHPELEESYFRCITDITIKFFDASNKLWDVYQEKEYNWERNSSDSEKNENTPEEKQEQVSSTKYKDESGEYKFAKRLISDAHSCGIKLRVEDGKLFSEYSNSDTFIAFKPELQRHRNTIIKIINEHNSSNKPVIAKKENVKKEDKNSENDADICEGKPILELPPKKEKKSARLQLVVYPEIKEAVRKEAELQGRSVNDVCNHIFAEAMGLVEESENGKD